MCPKEHFELKNDLSIGPGGWTKTFQSTGRKFSENLSKKQCLLRKNILEGLFWEKKLLEIFYNERNLLDFKRNVSFEVVRTASPNSSRKIWWWFSSKKTSSSFSDIEWMRSWFCLNNFLSLGLSRLHSMCSKEQFELKNDLSIGPGGWTKTFQSTGRKFSENLSKKQCLLRKNILEGLFWEKKLLEIFYNERNFLDFKRNVSLEVVRTASPNSSRKIWWWFSSKKNFFIIFGHWVNAIVILSK